MNASAAGQRVAQKRAGGGQRGKHGQRVNVPLGLPFPRARNSPRILFADYAAARVEVSLGGTRADRRSRSRLAVLIINAPPGRVPL